MQNNTMIPSFEDGQEMGEDYEVYTHTGIPWKSSFCSLAGKVAGEGGSSPLEDTSEKKTTQAIPCQQGPWAVGRKALVSSATRLQK